MQYQRGIATGCRWIIATGIVFIIFFAIVISAIRFYLGYALTQSHVEQLAARALHLPVSVARVRAHWYGFQPRIHLSHVILLDSTNKTPIVKLNQAVIQVDLYRSFLHREIVPAAVMIRGVRLRLTNSAAHQLMFRGGQVRGRQSSSFNISRLIHWLLLQKNISVDDVQLSDQHHLQLAQVALQLQQRQGQYRLYVHGQLGPSHTGTFRLQGDFTTSAATRQTTDGRFYINLTHITPRAYHVLRDHFPMSHRWPLYQLSGGVKSWVTIKHGQWSNLTTRYQLHRFQWGQLHLTNGHGLLRLVHHANAITVNWQHAGGSLSQQAWFESPLHVGRLSLQGVVHRRFHHNFFQLVRFHWENSALSLLLSGRLQPGRSAPRLDLLGALHIKQLSLLKQQLPLKKLRSNRAQWFDRAFQSGQLTHGQFVFRGPLTVPQFIQHDAHFEMTADVRGLAIKYSPVWPALFVPILHMSMHNQFLSIKSPHAISMQNVLDHIHVYMPDVERPELHVTLHGESTLHNTMQLLWYSPLFIPLQLKPLNMAGHLSLSLKLRLPLYLQGFLHAHASGDIQLNDDSISSRDWHLALAHVQGDLHFKDQFLKATKLTGELDHRPLTMSITTRRSLPEPITTVHVNGQLDTKALALRMHQPILSFWQGITPFALRLDFHMLDDPRGNTFYFASPLSGLSTHALPAPLAQSAIEHRPMTLVINVHHDQSIFVRADYNHQASAALVFHHAPAGFQFYSGDVELDSHLPSFKQVPGLQLNGRLHQLDVNQWLAFYHQLENKRAKHVTTQPLLIRSVDLKADSLRWHAFVLHHLSAHLHSIHQGWQLSVNSDHVAGSLNVPSQHQQPWIVRLSHLQLPAFKKNKAHWQIQLAQIPAIDAKIKRLSVGQHQDGALDFVTLPLADGLRLSHLDWHSPVGVVHLSGAWKKQGGHTETRLKGSIKSATWGRFLQRWQSRPPLVAGDGQLQFSAWWPGSPTHIVWSKLLGRLSLHVNNGAINHLSSKTMNTVGLGRLLNVLSVDSMMSHMRSHFKDMPAHGLWFNALNGHWAIRHGVAVTHDLFLDGEIAKVHGHGQVNLATHDIDMQLAITPQVTNSLPLVAGMLGGPIVGVAAWVVNKILGQQVDHLSASMVHVTGDWAHAHIKKIHRNGNQQV